MKKLVSLVISLIWCTCALADPAPYIYQPTPATTPVSGYRYPARLTAALAPYCAIDSSVQTAAATGLLKINSTGVAASGDAVVGMAGQTNQQGATGIPAVLQATDARYLVPSLTTRGALYVEVIGAGSSANANSMLRNMATGTWASGDVAAPIGHYREASLSTTGVGASDGKYSNSKVDSLGALWNHSASNVDSGAIITASGATTTQTSSDQTNFGGKCVKVVFDMTTVGTGSVTCTIQGKDTASAKYYTVLAGAAVTTNSTNVYTVCPGMTAAANSVANDFLPKTWRVQCVANNANATTYTVGASIVN